VPAAVPASADVVIVGAGTAGCVLAHRLAQRGDRSILLLEQGPAELPDDHTAPLSRLPIGPGSRRSRPVPERRGRPVVRGIGAGGSAAINGGYFLRPHVTDLVDWPGPWPVFAAAAYDAVDGGDDGGGLLHVSAPSDEELGDLPRAFEQYWLSRGQLAAGGAWPVVGVNRVRSNRVRGRRFTGAHVLAMAGGPPVQGGLTVQRLVQRDGRIVGVDCGDRQLAAGTVILAAGTLGTAELLRRSGIGESHVTVHEHAELFVRFTPRRPLSAPALLQSVLHTADGLEVRCYGDDFGRFIDGEPLRGVPIGVADLAEPVAGSFGSDGLDLGEPTAESLERLHTAAGRVVEMLGGEEFAELVEPGSIEIDPVIGMNQHALGSLPLGEALDPFGGVPGVAGLHVVDASVLPPHLRSGPHASVAMVAWALGSLLP